MNADDGLDVASTAASAVERLEAKNKARERALSVSRAVVRQCANSIRATHRREYDEAALALDSVATSLVDLQQSLSDHPDIYWAGYLQDAHKEYAEARITLAMVQHQPVPNHEQLGVEVAPYLNGMGEAVGELRREVLDVIRHGDAREADYLLEAMEAIYDLLVTIDYPDAFTGGLRRTTDNARGILERTRGDLTFALRAQRLESALRELDTSP